MTGTLFVVATPIGNLEDLAPRARRTLSEADLIAAEDTRHTGRLLSHFGIKTPQFALHDHNEAEVVASLIDKLLSGRNIALVSDAGTPLISDPGFRLVRAAHDHGIAVSPLPGPSAALAALAAAGLPTDRFCFEGFLPSRQALRLERLRELAGETRTMIFFVSRHRVQESLQDLVEVFGGERPGFLGRELTKLHEDCVQAPLEALAAQVRDGTIVGKGEFVLVVGGSPAAATAGYAVDTLLSELAAHLPAREAARIAARLTGEKRNALYARLLELRDDSAAY